MSEALNNERNNSTGNSSAGNTSAGNSSDGNSGADGYSSQHSNASSTGSGSKRGSNANAGNNSGNAELSSVDTDRHIRPTDSGIGTIAGKDPLDGIGSGNAERKRSRKSGGSNSGNSNGNSTGRNQASALAVKTRAKNIYGLHALAADFFKAPELRVSEPEAEAVSSALSDVLSHYDIAVDPKTQAWLTLAGVAVMVYGPRVPAITKRLKEQKPAAKPGSVELPGIAGFEIKPAQTAGMKFG